VHYDVLRQINNWSYMNAVITLPYMGKHPDTTRRTPRSNCIEIPFADLHDYEQAQVGLLSCL